MALLLDPGLGKTSIMLAAFKLLRKLGMARRMLVIAPRRPMQSTWPGEVAKWADFEDLKVAVLHGPKKNARLRSDADVYLVNPEGLAWFSREAAKMVRDRHFDILAVDESTKFKHTNTQRFKVLKPLLPYFNRRYILTGSFAPNGLLDLFGQVYILDLGNSLGTYITHYRLNYFDQVGYDWLPRRGSEELIYEKLRPLSLRMEAGDYLELPPLIYNKVEVELPPEALAIYRQMETQLLTAVREDIIVAVNIGVATMKCRQIANGGIYHDGGKTWSHIHSAKVDAVEDLVEELNGQPALIAYEYAHDLERLKERLGASTPHIGGGVSTTQFRAIEEAWNRGAIPVLLAQPQSVAHGLNLQGTSAAIINAGQTWDLEVREQFIQRVHRQGQKAAVVCHDIIAKNTIDEVIASTLMQKSRTQKDLLTALKTYASRRSK
jgi:SNF2 family DNA or RNA helicase